MAKRFRDKAQRESHIVEFVPQLLRNSEQETIPDRKRWREAENLFAGKQDWGQENEMSDWQSRVFLHEYAPIIREAATQVTNQIFERSEFVNLVPSADGSYDVAKIREKMIRYYIERIDLVQKFPEWCIAGCIYGFATWKMEPTLCTYYKPELVIDEIEEEYGKQMKGIKDVDKQNVLLPESLDTMRGDLERSIAKIFDFEGYKPPQIKAKKRLEMVPTLKLMNPFNYFWMADVAMNDSPWQADRSYSKFFQSIPLFDTNYYDKSKREELMKSRSSSQTGAISSNYSQKSFQRDQLQQADRYMPDVEIINYYGPLLDTNGDIIEEHCHFVIGNGKVLLRDSINLSWKKKAPYFSTVFNVRPFKPTGAGIADAAMDQQKVINNLFSLFLDSLQLDVYAPKAVNYDMLVDQSQIEGGIRPGELIGVFGGKASDAFSEVPRSANSASELFQTIEMLKLSGQKGASVNTMTSNPASRARISSAEINSNDGRRMQSISALGREIDQTCIEELVGRIDDMVLQHGFSNDNLELLASKGILTQSEYMLVANMSQTTRFVEADGHFKLEVRGFRAAMEREKFLAKAAELMQQIAQMPPPVQERLEWNRVLKDIVESYGFDSNAWIKQNSPIDKAREENELLKLNQFVEVWEQDEDAAHLPAHYEAILKFGPVPSLIAHTTGHINRMMQRGEPLPPPPPEVAQVLGMPAPQAAGEAQRGKQVSFDKQEGQGGPQRPPLMQ